jgi:integrase
MIPLNDPGLDRLRGAIRRRGERSASRALSAAVGAQTVSLALAVGCSWATVYEAAQPRSRSGDRYRPATIRRHELAWRRHLEPVIGHKQLTDIDRECVKALRAGFIRAGMASSTIANTFDPLRVVIREALEDGRLTVDPIAGMRIATGKKGRREHVANRAEAQVLIDALPVSEQALWATALYAGLRRGELKALRCHDLDFEADRIVVHHGWMTWRARPAPRATRRSVTYP